MRVPRYEKQVEQARLPANGFGTRATPEAFGAGIGQALQGAGAQLEAIALKEKDKFDTARVQQSAVDYDTFRIQRLHGEGGAYQVKGVGAVNLPETVLADLDKKRDEILGKLSGDNQRRAFSTLAAQSRSQDLLGLLRYSVGESDKLADASSAAYQSTRAQMAGLNFQDTARLAAEFKQSDNGLRSWARRKGIAEDSDVFSAAKLKQDTAMHSAVINRMLEQDPVGAWAYFQRNAEKMDAEARSKMDGSLFPKAAVVLADKSNAVGGPVARRPGPGADPSAPRGVRNNNPGNIMRGADNWQGEVKGSDPRYAEFESPEAGIRAMGKTLLTYQDKHGLRTVDDIVSRWAPATENDSAAYARAVAKELGIKPGDALDLRDEAMLGKMTRAMIRVENGDQPYSDEQINAGLSAAVHGTALPKTTSPETASRAEGDVSTLTGIPAIDELPEHRRNYVLRLAETRAREQRSATLGQLRNQEADAKAEYLATGEAKSPPSQADYVRAYGQTEGLQRHEELQGVAHLGQTLKLIKTLPVAALVDRVNNEKPLPGEGFAARQKNYEILVQAAGQVQKARQADPVAYAIQTGSFSLRPIERFDDPAALSAELKSRARAAGPMAIDYGTPLRVMTQPEADAFGQYLGTLQATDKARVLGGAFAAAGPDGMQSISVQLKDKSGTLSVAAMLTAYRTTSGNTPALLYLQGKEAIEQKRVKIDETAETGIKASIHKEIDGVYSSAQEIEAAAEATLGIYAKLKTEGSDDVGRAVRLATGGVMEHNGGRVAKPYGWEDDQFRAALWGPVAKRLADSDEELSIWGYRTRAADLAESIPGARLQTYRQGTYLIMVGSDPVRTLDGAPFVLRVGQ